MITYVNTVFVNNSTSTIGTVASATAATTADAGKFVIETNTNDAGVKTVRIGQVTDKTAVIRKKSGNSTTPIIRWANAINPADLKSFNVLSYKADVDEKVVAKFTSIDASVMSLLAEGGKRVVVRIQYKDLPTRYRKWSETYEYVTVAGDDATKIAAGIANSINYQYKRARVEASANAGVLTLTAMKYDDDNSVDSISPDDTVRFTVNIFYTDPTADGNGASVKHFPKGLTIDKTPGEKYAASAKLVRDREAASMGYEGILNRGEGTWPIIKPAMQTKLDGKYDGITIEFENHYRTADDWIKTTKQAIEIYGTKDMLSGVVTAIKTALGLNTTTAAAATGK